MVYHFLSLAFDGQLWTLETYDILSSNFVFYFINIIGIFCNTVCLYLQVVLKYTILSMLEFIIYIFIIIGIQQFAKRLMAQRLSCALLFLMN
jgi:hypothetical protein